MKLIEQLLKKPMWAAAGEEGSGGEGAGDPAPGVEGSPAPGDAAQGSGGEGGAAPGSKQSTLLDFAPKDGGKKEGAPPDGDAWKIPDGIEIPEHLRGTSAEDTLRKLSTAYKGARQELSSKRKADGVLEGVVPKDLDGYEITSDNPEDPIFKDLTSEASKPIVDAWRKAALELGIPNAAFSAFMQKGIANMAADGLSINGNPEEAQKINGEAQMQELVKSVGQAGADQMLRQIDTYAQKLANSGILQSQDDVREFSEMVGTARGLQIFNRILVAEFGEKAIPPGDPVAGSVTVAEAYQMQADARKMPDGPDRQAAVEAADAALAKALGESSTPGAVRSRVL